MHLNNNIIYILHLSEAALYSNLQDILLHNSFKDHLSRESQAVLIEGSKLGLCFFVLLMMPCS